MAGYDDDNEFSMLPTSPVNSESFVRVLSINGFLTWLPCIRENTLAHRRVLAPSFPLFYLLFSLLCISICLFPAFIAFSLRCFVFFRHFEHFSVARSLPLLSISFLSTRRRRIDPWPVSLGIFCLPGFIDLFKRSTGVFGNKQVAK